MVALGPSLSRLSGLGGSASLGVLFCLNIPACAALLILVLLGAAAAGGASGASFVMGVSPTTASLPFGTSLWSPRI